MQFEEFRRIVTCFADDVADVDMSHGELLIQIRDETITARLQQDAGELLVEEGGERTLASSWIVNRIARVPLLADRICSYIQPPDHFVRPSGRFLDQPDEAAADDDVYRHDVVETLTKALGRGAPETTDLMYLTSDAGEGKTSVIDYLAVKQARAYKARKTNWLLVPIALGGRTFLRFDDVVVSALVNRLRFQLLYYEAFLELVRLGVLVPAFDGFEEMIVETSSGEAVSALGNLVSRLESSGTLLVAARKAYFDYPSFRSQARLFDSIGSTGAVAFGRVSLNRWDKNAFCEYAKLCGVRSPEGLFTAVASSLSEDHPVLTRAVLVKRLVHLATEFFDTVDDLTVFVERIGQEPRDYFHEFVAGLVEREAKYKWLDTSGEPGQVILSTEEHHELLAMLALEMWLSGTDALRMDVVAIVVEMFATSKDKGPSITRQIAERIKQHALLVRAGVGQTSLAFDHDHFRLFYLGQALGRILGDGDVGELRHAIEKAAIPTSGVRETVSFVKRNRYAVKSCLEVLQRLADNEMPASFVKENCGAIALELVGVQSGPQELRNMLFPSGALEQKRLSDVTVTDSYFHPSSLAGSRMTNCKFHRCTFERLELEGPEDIAHSSMEECHISSVVRADDGGQLALFDPEQTRRELHRAGFEMIEDEEREEVPPPIDPDSELRMAQRFLRAFLRANALNEGTIRKKLGVKANEFFASVLPALLEVGVATDVPHRGRGDQRRLKLSVPMSRIEEAMSSAGGEFDRFVDSFRER